MVVMANGLISTTTTFDDSRLLRHKIQARAFVSKWTETIKTVNSAYEFIRQSLPGVLNGRCHGTQGVYLEVVRMVRIDQLRR
jgi:hypothetical protein